MNISTYKQGINSSSRYNLTYELTTIYPVTHSYKRYSVIQWLESVMYGVLLFAIPLAMMFI